MQSATSGGEKLGDEWNIDDVETAVAFEDDEGLRFGMHGDMVLVVDADALTIGEPQCEWPERALRDDVLQGLRCHPSSVVGSFRMFNSRQRPLACNTKASDKVAGQVARLFGAVRRPSAAFVGCGISQAGALAGASSASVGRGACWRAVSTRTWVPPIWTSRSLTTRWANSGRLQSPLRWPR